MNVISTILQALQEVLTPWVNDFKDVRRFFSRPGSAQAAIALQIPPPGLGCWVVEKPGT
jgi:hypothetical protein